MNSEIDFCTDLCAVGAKVALHTPDHPPLRKPLHFFCPFKSFLVTQSNLNKWRGATPPSGMVLFFAKYNSLLQMAQQLLVAHCPPARSRLARATRASWPPSPSSTSTLSTRKGRRLHLCFSSIHYPPQMYEEVLHDGAKAEGNLGRDRCGGTGHTRFCQSVY